MRAGVKAALAVAGVLILGIGGWRVWRMYGGGEADELPTFIEPAAGPRAPVSTGIGVTVGKSTLPEVEALVAAWGIPCEDTSARALMKKMRDKKQAEIAEKEARGEAVDANAGASWMNKKSRRELNPQIRYACADVKAPQLKDRERPAAEGRLLFVFDSEDLPLRHVSFRRLQKEPLAAYHDFRAALDTMTAVYGAPHVETGKIPVAEALAGAELFPKLVPIKREWNFSDIQVKVTVLNFGARGIDILESVEVPWPVRPDAPALPR